MGLQENLTRLRHKRHLSQEELAELLGVSRQTVSRWEVGAVVPTADNLLALGTLYGVSVEELMGGNIEEGLAVPPVDEAGPVEDVTAEPTEPCLQSVSEKPHNRRTLLIILACFYGGVLLWGQLTHSTGDAKIFLVFVTFLFILVSIMGKLKKMLI